MLGYCPKHRFIKTPDSELGLNYLCAGLRKYYAKVISDLLRIKVKLGWVRYKALTIAINYLSQLITLNY